MRFRHCLYNIVHSSAGKGVPHNMFSFNSFLIYLITPEIQAIVNLKGIAYLAKTVAQVVNKWNNPFCSDMQSVECLKLVVEPRIVSNNFVVPAEMQNSLNLSGSYIISCLFVTISLYTSSWPYQLPCSCHILQ